MMRVYDVWSLIIAWCGISTRSFHNSENQQWLKMSVVTLALRINQYKGVTIRRVSLPGIRSRSSKMGRQLNGENRYKNLYTYPRNRRPVKSHWSFLVNEGNDINGKAAKKMNLILSRSCLYFHGRLKQFLGVRGVGVLEHYWSCSQCSSCFCCNVGSRVLRRHLVNSPRGVHIFGPLPALVIQVWICYLRPHNKAADFNILHMVWN